MTTDQQENYNNFMLLRTYLIANKSIIEPKLDMGVFREKEYENDTECGTIGCILGHSIEIPELRVYIDKPLDELETNDYELYAHEAFGLIRYFTDDWDILFGPYHTNSIDDFITRLDRYLEKTFAQSKKEQCND